MTQFPVLGEHAYVSHVGPLTHRGANATTHLAEVRYPVQSAPVISVVKFMQPDGLRACNEAISWLFLRAAGISAPKHAAILALSHAKAVQAVGRQSVPEEWVQQGHVLAWASQKLDFGSIQALFAGSEADAKWLDVLRSAKGAAIAAFDELFFNIDRNTGNVLFTRSGVCVPIDHELVFGQQNWLTGELQHLSSPGDSLRVLVRARDARKLPLAEFDNVRNHMVHVAQAHEGALRACQDEISSLVAQVFPTQAADLARRILSFVGDRATQQWLQDRLGVI
ncbi:hypothetical protein [Paracidovorax wautersii]|uniref:hypothetical protein n=1 Tax=Paracidovorax wautersii TaxID=1177982 RepID=UPI0031CF0280